MAPEPPADDGLVPAARITAALALFASAGVPELSRAHHVCENEQLVGIRGQPSLILVGALLGIVLALAALTLSALAWRRSHARSGLAVGLSIAALVVALGMIIVWLFYFTDGNPCVPWTFL